MSASGRHSRYYRLTFDLKERSERLNAISHTLTKSESVADVPVSAPQTQVAQLEATIRSAHALLQAGLIDEAISLLAASLCLLGAALLVRRD